MHARDDCRALERTADRSVKCYACYTMKRIEIETLPHRELRNRSSDVLRRVQEGARFQITNHGVVVAVIGPAGTRPDLGVRRAVVRGGFASLPRALIAGSSQDHMDALRGDR